VLLHLAHAGLGCTTSAASGCGVDRIAVLRRRYGEDGELLFHQGAGAMGTVGGGIVARNDLLEFLSTFLTEVLE
jgi:hypothetical protein